MKATGHIQIEIDGYTAEVELDESGKFFHGQILVGKDVISFQADTDIIKEMKLSIVDYLGFKDEVRPNHYPEKTEEHIKATILGFGWKLEDYDENWVRKKNR